MRIYKPTSNELETISVIPLKWNEGLKSFEWVYDTRTFAVEYIDEGILYDIPTRMGDLRMRCIVVENGEYYIIDLDDDHQSFLKQEEVYKYNESGLSWLQAFEIAYL